MANYKKITDVEVMEQVGENSMALVEDNGTLKKVPCAGFGGGNNNAIIIRYHDGNYSCDISYAEFLALTNTYMIPPIFLIMTSSGYPGCMNTYFCTYMECRSGVFQMSFQGGSPDGMQSSSVAWSEDEIYNPR